MKLSAADYMMIAGVILVLISGAVKFTDLSTDDPFYVSPESASVVVGEQQTFTAVVNVGYQISTETWLTWRVDGSEVANGQVGVGGFGWTYTTSSDLDVGAHSIECTVLADYGAIYYTAYATLNVIPEGAPTPSSTPPPTPSPAPPGSINVLVSVTEGGTTYPEARSESYTYSVGSVVTLTATASEGYYFVAWQFSSGATSANNPFVTVATESFGVQALFASFEDGSITPTPSPSTSPSPIGSPEPSESPSVTSSPFPTSSPSPVQFDSDVVTWLLGGLGAVLVCVGAVTKIKRRKR